MEISGFHCHSGFTWNQFWSYWSPKKLSLHQFSSLEFLFFVTFSSVKFPKNQNSKPSKWLNGNFWCFIINSNWFHVKSEWQENWKCPRCENIICRWFSFQKKKKIMIFFRKIDSFINPQFFPYTVHIFYFCFFDHEIVDSWS